MCTSRARAPTRLLRSTKSWLHHSPLTYAHNVRTLESWVSSGTKRAKPGSTFANTGVRMPEAIPVFDYPYAITITDDESNPNEQRFVTLGIGAAGRLLVVVYTWRGKNIRMISVRPAEAREREEYEAEP
jgi:uncharacterized protein